VVTISYMGGPSVAPSITAMFETQPTGTSASQNRRTRFVNAVPGATLDLGISMETTLPATMTTRLASGVEFGHAPDTSRAAPGFSFDANGYLSFASIPLPLVAVQQGTNDAILLAICAGSGIFTLYAIGDPHTALPIRGLLCNEAKKDTALANCSLSDLPSSN
jgi:hypothetical protein